MINTLDQFMQLTVGLPGATRLQSALAGWISRYTT